MTVRTVLEAATAGFAWLDVVNPSPEELSGIATSHGLHSVSVQDCLDPEHLPKFEQFETYAFAIIRVYDESSSATCSTVQELTRKVAVFYAPAFLIIIHRKEQGWLSRIEQRLIGDASTAGAKERESVQARVITRLLNAAADTYSQPLEALEARIDRYEESVFASTDAPATALAATLREIHLIKRQVTLVKRLLWRFLEVVQRMTPPSGRAASLFRDVQENVESYHFYADELLDDVNTLLNIQLSLATHRTNEVMRVLTVFSVFFLPLTFIVGVYGMNFQFMPELREHWGYPAILAAMGVVTLVIFLWFRRRGWLRG
ncbi:MAG: CorA family divalent cation transporter [Gemmatimonadales bacterium]